MQDVRTYTQTAFGRFARTFDLAAAKGVGGGPGYRAPSARGSGAAAQRELPRRLRGVGSARGAAVLGAAGLCSDLIAVHRWRGIVENDDQHRRFWHKSYLMWAWSNPSRRAVSRNPETAAQTSARTAIPTTKFGHGSVARTAARAKNT